MDTEKVRSLKEKLAAAEEALRLSDQRSVAGQLATFRTFCSPRPTGRVQSEHFPRLLKAPCQRRRIP